MSPQTVPRPQTVPQCQPWIPQARLTQPWHELISAGCKRPTDTQIFRLDSAVVANSDEARRLRRCAEVNYRIEGSGRAQALRFCGTGRLAPYR